MKKITLIIILGIFTSFNLFGRSPAVEPVMGISIEEYENVPPEEATPYDFAETSQAKAPSRAPAIEVPSSFEFTAPSRTFSQVEAETNVPPYLIFMALLLPLIVWFGLLKNLDKSFENPAQAENMVNIEELRKKRAKAESEDDVSKAS